MFKQKKLFTGKNIAPSCSYCKFGNRASGSDMILCEKFGVVSAGYACKKYSYAPLKRVPRPPPTLTAFDEDDFKL